jgi:hypothetical protein
MQKINFTAANPSILPLVRGGMERQTLARHDKLIVHAIALKTGAADLGRAVG